MPFFLLCLIALTAFQASAQRMLLIAGNGQVAMENFPASKPMVVRVVDAAGRGVPNTPVTWTVRPADGGAFQPHDPNTDAEGYARVTFFGSFLPPPNSYRTSTVTASSSAGLVEMFATTVSSQRGPTPPQTEIIAPIGQQLSGPAGSVIPRAIGIRVAALAGIQVGQGIPFVGVRIQDPEDPNLPYATCEGPNNTVLTDSKGEAWCDLRLGSIVGEAFVRAVVGDLQVTNPIRVAITQSTAPSCTFNLSSSTISVPPTGGSSSVTLSVTSGQNCAWTASSGTSWITITSGASGTGGGTVAFTVGQNTGAARTGTLTIAGQTLAVNQAAQGTPGPGPITFTSPNPLPNAVVGSAYQYQLGASGGTPPYSWSATGTSPPGLALGANGLITGTPTAAGAFGFTIRVQDVLGAAASQSFNITVSSVSTGGVVITTTTLPAGTVGTPYQQTLSATGACAQNPFGGGGLTWALVSGTVPAGLLFSGGSSATISGTPTTAGTSTFTVRAIDTCGRSDTRAVTIVIAPSGSTNPVTMTATPANVEFSVAYTAANSAEQPVAIASGGTPVQFTAATPTPWIRITSTSGTTPAQIGIQAINIASFAAGIYEGAIAISSSASNSPLNVPVRLRVGSPANVTVSRESLLFQHTPQSTVSQQSITVGGVITQIPYFVTLGTETGGNWLSVNPTSGVTQSNISVTVNSAGLAAGTYRGTVRVVPEGNAGGAISVPVTLVVSAPNSLIVSRVPLAFSGSGSQTLQISTAVGVVSFTATASGGTWLTVAAGAERAPTLVTVTVNAAGMQPGNYEGRITLRAADGSEPIVVPVNLTITESAPMITSVKNGASFAVGAIAPGQVITIFGSNLGPNPIAEAGFDATNTLPTTLADIRVTFDNVAAPILHALDTQVSVIVPFGVAGKSTVQVQVFKGSQGSNAVAVPVTEAAPGIFLADQTTGQGAILNSNLSYNLPDNGAEPGDIIALFATGAGLMDLQVFDGRIVPLEPPYPRPLLPVEVRIGGRVAEIAYVGAGPGQVAGVLQVNARIPADTPRGSQVPVQLLVGNATSQSNVVLTTRP